MDFLLVAILLAWSFASSFLPLSEKRLRSLMVANAVLTSLALLALAIPAIAGNPTSIFENLFTVDQLRGLIIVPIAMSWLSGVVAFALWWGASFKSGTGTRPLFCLRSYTLVGAFAGIVLMLLTNSLPLVLLGLLLTFFMACVGVLFQVTDGVLHHVRMFALGLGGALIALAGGVALLLFAGYQATGTLMLTGDAVRAAEMGTVGPLAMLGITLTGFAGMWFMGLLPGMTWYRKGVANLPKGQRLIMRVFLPAALFPHFLTLSAWGGASGELFVQKMLLLFGLFAGITLVEYLRAQEGVSDSFVVLLLAMALVSMGYGPAGAIPALMMIMMLVFVGTLFLLVHGGVWLKSGVKKYAVAVVAGVPFVSPLFVPYALSVGYGIQMMPLVACISSAVLVYATYMLSCRVFRAWSEAEPKYSDMWGARVATVLLAGMTVYGCWFMYADALSLMVDAVGGV